VIVEKYYPLYTFVRDEYYNILYCGGVVRNSILVAVDKISIITTIRFRDTYIILQKKYRFLQTLIIIYYMYC
jgi:hypothetical protein